MLFKPTDCTPEEVRSGTRFAARTIVDRRPTRRQDIARLMSERPRIAA